MLRPAITKSYNTALFIIEKIANSVWGFYENH